jgi:hypothetical protein
MDAISLSWGQMAAIAGGTFAVLTALGTAAWTWRGHWKDLYEAKEKELNRVSAQLEKAQAEIDSLKEKLSDRAKGGEITSTRDLPGGFTKLTEAYRASDNIVDDEKRKARKDSLALKLGWFAIGRDIPRHVLVQSGDPGAIVALAQKIIEQPKDGDVKWLVSASQLWAPPHARHQVIDAIEILAKKRKLDAAERTELLNVLERFDMELRRDKAAATHTAHIERARQAVEGGLI